MIAMTNLGTTAMPLIVRRARPALVASACLLLYSPVTRAQQAGPASQDGSLRFMHNAWTTQHGLPTPAISAIAQDRHGYLWLGSFAGLYRFDGVGFVHWNDIGAPALPESLVHAVMVSTDGTLWVAFGNLGGVGRIRGDRLQVYTARDGVPEGSVQSLAEDHEGTVWAAGLGGLGRFRGERWEAVGVRQGLGRLFAAPDGTLYVTSATGVYRHDPSTDALAPVDASRRTVDVTVDGGGTLWATGERETLWRVGASTPTLAAWRGIDGYRLLRDRRGHLWIATVGQGLLHIPADAWTGNPEATHITQRQGLTNDRVLSLFEDAEGSVWVGTSGGLNQFTPHVGPGPVISRPELDGRDVRAVAVAPDGAVWAGTANGVVRLEAGQPTWYNERHGLPSPAVRALHAGADGRLWVATDRGPAVFAHGRFVPLKLPPDLRLNGITAMTTDAAGGVWLFDSEGTYRWVDGRVAPMPLADRPRRPRGTAALVDRQGRVWVGFSRGGVVVHDHGRTTAYSAADGLSEDTVTAIDEDEAGRIWIGTIHGLSRFDGGRFTTLTQGRGLPGTRLTGVLGDGDGQLWMGTDFGFVRISPDEFDSAARHGTRVPYRPVEAADGLDGIPTNRGYPNAARLPDGRLGFVTSSGLTVVDPQALREPLVPAAPRIERVIADDRAFAPSDVRLPPLTARLQIDYTSVRLSAASRVRFRFKLEGNDAEWIDAGARRQAFYTNLPPGAYRFRVAARIGGGEWMEAAEPWAFSIQPAVYQTAWFSVLCFVALASAAWVAWRSRVHQVRRQHALVMAERVRLAREIHDTLLQAMAGVALLLHGALESIAASSPARELCERARDSLEQHIREARLAIWRLRSPESGDDVVARLQRTAEDMTAGSGVTVSFRVGGGRVPCARQIESHLVRIGQEAIRNAVRHAGAARVLVDLRYEPRQITLRVEDDGRGFDPARTNLKAHWGLAGMREHAELVGGQLSLTAAPGQGTVVEAVIPVRG